MGIVNVTPDSFSDGGRYLATADAVAHGVRLAIAGADVVDVGGESTRPGCSRTTEDDELSRVLPVVRALVGHGIVVSIDTMRASVARAAVAAGAAMVNDVSGGLADPEMTKCVAGLGVHYVAMHWRGHSAHMQHNADYRDVVDAVQTELRRRRDAALNAGIAPDRLILDPGLGFAKNGDHNWTLLRRLDELLVLGQPLMVGASRKRFLADIIPARGRVTDLDRATAAVSAIAVTRGASWVRVHDVRSTIDGIRATAPPRDHTGLHELSAAGELRQRCPARQR